MDWTTLYQLANQAAEDQYRQDNSGNFAKTKWLQLAAQDPQAAFNQDMEQRDQLRNRWSGSVDKMKDVVNSAQVNKDYNTYMAGRGGKPVTYGNANPVQDWSLMGGKWQQGPASQGNEWDNYLNDIRQGARKAGVGGSPVGQQLSWGNYSYPTGRETPEQIYQSVAEPLGLKPIPEPPVNRGWADRAASMFSEPYSEGMDAGTPTDIYGALNQLAASSPWFNDFIERISKRRNATAPRGLGSIPVGAYNVLDALFSRR